MVYSIAARYFGGTGEAEEVAQEVFLELYTTRRPPTSPAHLVAWLRRVTAHRCIDITRRREHRHEVAVDAVPDVVDAHPLPDPLLRDRLRVLVRSLPDTPRMIIILRYAEDMDVREIAEALEMPVSTAWSHLQRGMALLREKAAATLQKGAYVSRG